MVSCKSESELHENFSELRANNHCTPQTPKCFEWNILFDVEWKILFWFLTNSNILWNMENLYMEVTSNEKIKTFHFQNVKMKPFHFSLISFVWSQQFSKFDTNSWNIYVMMSLHFISINSLQLKTMHSLSIASCCPATPLTTSGSSLRYFKTWIKSVTDSNKNDKYVSFFIKI